MATQTIGTTAWESVTTTTADTVFQNKGAHPIYITTESTSGLDFSDGFYLEPQGGAIVISSSQDVSAVSFNSDNELFYVEV
jgi:hypothetical protein